MATGAPEIEPIVLLMVEDNETDAEIVEHTLKRQKIRNHLYTVTNYQGAVDFLSKKGAYKTAPRPHAVMVDINLNHPDKNGLDIVRFMRSTPALCTIPTVIVSAADSDEAMIDARNAGVDIYVKKPFDRERLLEVIDRIEHFWLQVIKVAQPA